MVFEQPWWFWSLVVIAPFMVWDLRRRWDGGSVRRLASVALRSVLLLSIVAALAEPVWLHDEARQDIVFVVDRSASVGEDALAETLRRVDALRGELDETEEAGLVLFDAESEVVGIPGEAWGIPQVDRGTPVLATDVSRAVRTALGLVRPERGGRVVLFTDGRSNRGAIADAVAAARERGIPIDVMPVGSAPERPEVHAVEVEGDTVRPGQTLRGVVVAQGGQEEVSGPLEVRLDDRVIARLDVELPPGEVVEIPFEHPVASTVEPGVHDLGVELEGASVLETGLVVGARPKVWMLVNEVREVRHLRRLLEAESMDVEVLPPAATVVRADALAEVDLVILGDVPLTPGAEGPAALPPEGAANLRRYVSAGGGLVTLGGEEAYALEGWRDSELAKALPVEVDPESMQVDPAVTMIIILDKSGSMNERARGGATKMSLADEGAVASMGLLRPIDRIGVMAVDDRVQWVVPVQQLADKERLARRVLGVRAGGGGIYIYTSLLAAEKELERSPTPLKHVIVFSDARDSEEKVQGIPFGWGPGPNSYELAERMRKKGITVSVIGIGTRRDQDAEFLELLAEIGGGRNYLTNDATELRSLFVAETKEIVKSTVKESAFQVRALREHPVLEGLDVATAPPLAGYLEVVARDTAEVLLVGPDEDPILTTWQYGLGQVASLSTDAGPRWAADWLGWEGYGTLWTQLARWALKRQEGAETAAALEWTDRGQLQVEVVRRTPGGLARAEPIAATLAGADGVAVPVPMRVIEPGLWRGTVDVAPGGRSTLEVRSDGEVLVERRLVAPASPELRDRSPDREALSALAEATGGRFEARGPGAVLRAGAGREALWWWLLLVGLLLVPVDAFLRRPARRV